MLDKVGQHRAERDHRIDTLAVEQIDALLSRLAAGGERGDHENFCERSRAAKGICRAGKRFRPREAKHLRRMRQHGLSKYFRVPRLNHHHRTRERL